MGWVGEGGSSGTDLQRDGGDESRKFGRSRTVGLFRLRHDSSSDLEGGLTCCTNFFVAYFNTSSTRMNIFNMSVFLHPVEFV